MALNLGKLSLDIVVNGKPLDELNNKIKNTSSSLGGLGEVGKKVMRMLSFTAITASIYKLGKSAVTAYADFQQLAGGVETLFGESAAQVMDDASRAYAEAGISANQYMEQATSFSASLIQSLGGDTKKAAEYANIAIVDMSDNANKMGTNIEMIQNAYQGFAKQNFTMLDNLKLGYGGTKTEMERLLSDAEKISGLDFDISSYADIVQAIHIIQQENGIAGTTAEEAATTITGSLNMMKAAWQDMLTVVANPESSDKDVTKAIQNFADSLQVFLDNILPVLENMVPQIVDIFSRVFKTVYDSLEESGTINEIKEGLVNAIKTAVEDLADNLPEIIGDLINTFPGAITAAAGWKLVTASFNQAWIKALEEATPTQGQLPTNKADIGKILAALLGNGAFLAAAAIAIPIIFVATGITSDIEGNEVTTAMEESLVENQGKEANATVNNVNKLNAAKGIIKAIKKDYDSLPDEVKTKMEAEDNATGKVKVLAQNYEQLPPEVRSEIEAEMLNADDLTAYSDVLSRLPLNVQTKIKNNAAEKTKTAKNYNKILDELPEEKRTKVETLVEQTGLTKLQALATQLDGLPTEKKIQVYTDYTTTYNTKGQDSSNPSSSSSLGKDYKVVNGKVYQKVNGEWRPLRTGTREIPYDGYPTMLHQGEMVLTAAEANQYQNYLKGAENTANSTVFNITGNTFRNRDDIDYLCTEIQKKISRQLAR